MLYCSGGHYSHHRVKSQKECLLSTLTISTNLVAHYEWGSQRCYMFWFTNLTFRRYMVGRDDFNVRYEEFTTHKRGDIAKCATFTLGLHSSKHTSGFVGAANHHKKYVHYFFINERMFLLSRTSKGDSRKYRDKRQQNQV